MMRKGKVFVGWVRAKPVTQHFQLRDGVGLRANALTQPTGPNLSARLA